MRLPNRLMIGAATVLALASTTAATLGPAVATVHAAPADPDARCAWTDRETGEIVFYLPGETLTDELGTTWTCGPTGSWYIASRVSRAVGAVAPRATRALP